MNAPIVIFGFNRPVPFKNMIESLRKNVGFENHDIFVFIDGPRNERDKDCIDEVTKLAKELTSNVYVSDKNKGLATSIISGVTKIINQHGKAIIIEDDLILMPGFLRYMDEALDAYEYDSRIFSICGYGLKIKKPKDYTHDVYLLNRSSSWGWATWKDRWDSIDWNIHDWVQLKDSKKRQQDFNQGGSDLYGMFRDCMEGRNNSWAIRFCYNQFLQGKYSLHPFKSLVANEGYGLDATNCRQKYSRFKIDLNDKIEKINLPQDVKPDTRIIKRSRRYHSIPMRIYSRLRRILNI